MAGKERKRENKILLSVNVLRPLRVLGLFSSTYSPPSFTTLLLLLRRITLRGFGGGIVTRDVDDDRTTEGVQVQIFEYVLHESRSWGTNASAVRSRGVAKNSQRIFPLL
jgi:hypothetical protein